MRGCSNIVGAEVYSFTSEAELLSAWRAFVIQSDPDILTGYNINNFDLPYLIHRAEALKLGSFLFLGRIKNVKSRVRESTFSSKVVPVPVVVALLTAPPRRMARASHTRPQSTGACRLTCCRFCSATTRLAALLAAPCADCVPLPCSCARTASMQ